jgi:hypothetical protein
MEILHKLISIEAVDVLYYSWSTKWAYASFQFMVDIQYYIEHVPINEMKCYISLISSTKKITIKNKRLK